MSEISLIAAILKERCPRCRKGKLYKYPFYRISKFAKMNDKCSCCGLRFEIEPGFYFGAMYISYAFVVALFVATSLFLKVIFDPDLIYYLITLPVISVILMPIIFRFSRTIYLYLVGGIKFDPNRVIQHENC
ncbi:DUF983 domain-containing protein [Mangrovivirga cuniculi]|uniref:DUF983 domain-containing protein n=2 Tax=Mangrovivirga cuniculi TaxID=2715131 RepID=A0A4D7K5J0_9BACT|nr:DUF983 domain-containing protein [Mangrovivirga cuniculi]